MDNGRELLREELLDYYGTAAFNGNAAAMDLLGNIEFADDDELRAFADGAGIEAGSYLDEEDDWFGW